ncbi:MAG TPA: hypothetical protein VIK71_07910 [Flavobacteriales bacterium]
MSNKSSDSLFRLIKSMTKAEKRYFKVFSSRHIIGDSNNYLLLFNAIDAMSEYDEEALLKKFKGKSFVARFSISKNRLYNALLKCLDSFHSNSSVDAQLQRQLHSIEILYHKSLYAQSMKLLQSAAKVAEKHEKYTILAEIYKWEKRILEKDNYEEIKSDARIDKILQADRQLTKKLQNYNELWNIKSKIFSQLYKHGKVRSESERARLYQYIREATALFDGKVEGTENAYLLNHIYSGYYFSLGDYAACYPYLLDNLKLIEKKSHLFREEPNIYLSVLTNAIYVGIRLGKWKEARAHIDKLQRMPEQLSVHLNEDLEFRLFTLTKSTELTLYTQSGEFEKGLELVAAIEEGLAKYDDLLSSVRKAHFYFNVAIIYFGLEQYKEALRWVNKLLNNIEIDKTQDIHCIAQILNLVVHLELGNKELLPYALRSTQRFLATRNKAFEFERVMLAFVNESLKKRQDKTQQELYNDLVAQLEVLRKNPMEQIVFEYFDFLAWAKSKASGVKYREMLAA